MTGHEVSHGAHVTIDPAHAAIFEFIQAHPDIFTGFFHVGLETNIRPKLRILQEHGFYPATAEELAAPESCGAHSARVAEPADMQYSNSVAKYCTGMASLVVGGRRLPPL